LLAVILLEVGGLKLYCVTHLSSIIQHMGDTMDHRPDHECLFQIAHGQHGYFTSAQAKSCDFSRSLLSHQAKTGRYIRIRRGLYRLRDFPSYPREGVVAAWLTVGKDSAVVSHESALELFELSDVIPHAIHLTVPRSRRNLPDLPGVKIHTTAKQFGPLDIVNRDGIRLTSAARTILDVAETGTAPEQVEMAIHEALERGLVSKRRLWQDALNRSQRVQQLVHGSLN
jgi:predicted transcriptional regulator of viral defense system